ncbi:hypothetical protein AXG93_3256s1700 [Marchantia polymorpha subsp. ruderalis]|uniref:Uncharacterized protein n=1 Tax=Marchantia polymorpha subsp. ruderalis TaxID=1480154 RepID=A0A176VKK2_MARPO|nr:hypothetical protein AXG93_3256s1700 [Marchantia polymorpha subsp. ruderalis]
MGLFNLTSDDQVLLIRETRRAYRAVQKTCSPGKVSTMAPDVVAHLYTFKWCPALPATKRCLGLCGEPILASISTQSNFKGQSKDPDAQSRSRRTEYLAKLLSWITIQFPPMLDRSLITILPKLPTEETESYHGRGLLYPLFPVPHSALAISLHKNRTERKQGLAQAVPSVSGIGAI